MTRQLSSSDDVTITFPQTLNRRWPTLSCRNRPGLPELLLLLLRDSPAVLSRRTSFSMTATYYWQTQGITNQFAKMQFFDQQNVFIDRVRLQSQPGFGSPTTLVKDFDVQISATTSDDASFVTVLSGTLLNNAQMQEFVFPGGPVRTRLLEAIAQELTMATRVISSWHLQSRCRWQCRQPAFTSGSIKCGALQSPALP